MTEDKLVKRVGKWVCIFKNKNGKYKVDYDLFRDKPSTNKDVSNYGLELIFYLFLENIPKKYRKRIGNTDTYCFSFWDDEDSVVMSISEVYGSIHNINSYNKALEIAKSLDSIINRHFIDLRNKKHQK